VDNQHKLIRGYRDLTEREISTINSVKDIGVQLGDLIAVLDNEKSTDKRWVSIAQTHFQQGIMAAVRSIAKPEIF
jgi:hypothetical protein